MALLRQKAKVKVEEQVSFDDLESLSSRIEPTVEIICTSLSSKAKPVMMKCCEQDTIEMIGERLARQGGEQLTRKGDEKDAKFARKGDEHDVKFARKGDEHDTKFARKGDEHDAKFARKGDEKDAKFARKGDERDSDRVRARFPRLGIMRQKKTTWLDPKRRLDQVASGKQRVHLVYQ